MGVSRDEVVWCYRKLLGREPESELVVAQHAKQPDFRTLVEGFAHSEEFVSRVGEKRFEVAAPIGRLAKSLDLLERSHFEPRGLILRIVTDCDTGHAGDNIALPVDDVIFPAVVTQGNWSFETLTFLEQRIDQATPYVVLDIGANVGMFTRQVALRFPDLKRFICVEPEPANFQALEFNVANLLGSRGTLWNLALSDSDSRSRFFRDESNIGNYSLNNDAMRGQTFDTIDVRAVATDRWMQEHIHLGPAERLIWKSDTQGSDELVICLTPQAIWDRIDIAIVELWRIKKPVFDRDLFCRRIDAFPNKSIVNLGVRHATTEILDYLSGDDYAHSDLHLWR